MAAKIRFQTADKNIARLELFEQKGVLINCARCGQVVASHSGSEEYAYGRSQVLPQC